MVSRASPASFTPSFKATVESDRRARTDRRSGLDRHTCVFCPLRTSTFAAEAIFGAFRTFEQSFVGCAMDLHLGSSSSSRVEEET